jgi:hypothetical protein
LELDIFVLGKDSMEITCEHGNKHSDSREC